MTETKPVHGKELMFPSDYLAAVEFEGKDVTLTIKAIAKRDLITKDGTKTKNWIVEFEETKKKWVLKPTNAGSLASLHGKQAMDWIGKKITLYPTTCVAFGDPDMPCIRVRKTAPGSSNGSPPPEPDRPAFNPDEAQGDEGFGQKLDNYPAPEYEPS